MQYQKDKLVRARWYLYLNEPDLKNPVSFFVTFGLAFFVLINIAQIVLGSVSDIEREMGRWFEISVYVFALIFAAEYLMRIWVAAESPHEHNQTAFRKRIGYILSPMGIIDLISFLPVFLWWILEEQTGLDLRMLKLISMIRVLKLTRYSASFLILSKVLQENKNTLLAAAMVMFILMLIASTGIYVFERHAQPASFGSIPESMWWAFVTITTVGYGDVTPITLGGKMFAVVVMICGVGIAAMPAGIFASSFVQLVREQEHERRRHMNRAKSENSKPLLQVVMSASEEREVDYLMAEYGLNLEQALGVVKHFRHHEKVDRSPAS